MKKRLADELSRSIPAGLGSTGHVHLSARQMRGMLQRGAQWAVVQGYGKDGVVEKGGEVGTLGMHQRLNAI